MNKFESSQEDGNGATQADSSQAGHEAPTQRESELS